jgi:cytidyltransferase-like protein
MPSSPLDHITNTYVLRSAISTAVATSPPSSLHVLLRATSVNPTPNRAQVFDYLQEMYRYIWDAISTSPASSTPAPLLDVLLYPPLPNVAAASLVELDPTITTIVGTVSSRGWFTKGSISEASGPDGTLLDHANAVSAARVARNLSPIANVVQLDAPPEVRCLTSDDNKDDVVFYELAGYSSPDMPPGNSSDPTCNYAHVAVGGTFDRLHYGHRRLLTLALSSVCSNSGVLTVGVTSDSMIAEKVKKKKAKSGDAVAEMNIQDEKTRLANVRSFVSRLGVGVKNRVRYVLLNDKFGPVITDPTVSALVCSSETLAGGVECNRIREEAGFDKVKMLVAIRGEEGGMSSTSLRRKQAESGGG